MLLDFGANPNAVSKNKSLLSIAAEHGFSDSIRMLIEAGAKLDVGAIPPLISVLKSGSRQSLEALLEKNPREILSNFGSQPIIYHAINEKTTLLPIIATRVKDEIEKMKNNGEPNPPPFPPEGLTSSQQKRLKISLEREDSVTTTVMMTSKPKPVRTIWQLNNGKPHDESTIASEFMHAGDEMMCLAERDGASVSQRSKATSKAASKATSIASKTPSVASKTPSVASKPKSVASRHSVAPPSPIDNMEYEEDDALPPEDDDYYDYDIEDQIPMMA